MTGYFIGNKMNNLFNRFDGKTADIHQENRVELANLGTHIPPLPVMQTINKPMQLIFGLLSLILCGVLWLLAIVIFSLKVANLIDILMGVSLVLIGLYLIYIFIEKLMVFKQPYLYCINKDGVNFVKHGKMNRIGFDKAYWAVYLCDATFGGGALWIYHISFSDDGMYYKKHKTRIANFMFYEKHDKEHAVLINTLIQQYHQKHDVKNIPKIKYIAQR